MHKAAWFWVFPVVWGTSLGTPAIASPASLALVANLSMASDSQPVTAVATASATSGDTASVPLPTASKATGSAMIMPIVPPPPLPVVATGSALATAATASSEPARSGGAFDLSWWPPKMPPLLGIEVIIGQNWGKTTTFFPAFPNKTLSVGGISQTLPDLENPKLVSQAGNGKNSGGQAELQLRVPFLSPALGVEFAWADQPSDVVVDAGDTTASQVNDILPTRQLGVYGKLLGLKIGLRNETFASLPGMTGEVSANTMIGGYSMGLGLGPVEAAANLEAGIGQLPGTTGSVIVPGKASVHLGLAVFGLKVVAGFRAQATAYGSDPGALTKLFSLSELVKNVDLTNPTAEAQAKANQIQNLARLSLLWGPFVQAGLAF
ncbi:MAG: hypothetical protein HY692_04320 [Cyanobacteria bacterium NC_groundwater_1444_Ag_S-0.65um_54_12]|nr:hypothetical protein [Cyanobacteria bacterium NC_groundwater_1444_Ag_S-0.65um_54_12]